MRRSFLLPRFKRSDMPKDILRNGSDPPEPRRGAYCDFSRSAELKSGDRLTDLHRMNPRVLHEPNHTERDAALAEFFATVRAEARESESAVARAKPALGRLAAAIVGRDNGQALRVRAILISLYTGGSMLADVSDLMALDWSLRKDLCAVLLAFGHGEFGYDYLKNAFERAGDRDAQWFLAAAADPNERLREALAFAKPGTLATMPRTLSEKGMAEILVSLFSSGPVDLSFALQGLDASRASLIVDLVADYAAGRFDCSAREIVREHFA